MYILHFLHLSQRTKESLKCRLREKEFISQVPMSTWRPRKLAIVGVELLLYFTAISISFTMSKSLIYLKPQKSQKSSWIVSLSIPRSVLLIPLFLSLQKSVWNNFCSSNRYLPREHGLRIFIAFLHDRHGGSFCVHFQIINDVVLIILSVHVLFASPITRAVHFGTFFLISFRTEEWRMTNLQEKKVIYGTHTFALFIPPKNATAYKS